MKDLPDTRGTGYEWRRTSAAHGTVDDRCGSGARCPEIPPDGLQHGLQRGFGRSLGMRIAPRRPGAVLGVLPRINPVTGLTGTVSHIRLTRRRRRGLKASMSRSAGDADGSATRYLEFHPGSLGDDLLGALRSVLTSTWTPRSCCRASTQDLDGRPGERWMRFGQRL